MDSGTDSIPPLMILLDKKIYEIRINYEIRYAHAYFFFYIDNTCPSEHCTPEQFEQGSLQSLQSFHSGLADFKSHTACISSFVWALAGEMKTLQKRSSTQKGNTFKRRISFSFSFLGLYTFSLLKIK